MELYLGLSVFVGSLLIIGLMIFIHHQKEKTRRETIKDLATRWRLGYIETASEEFSNQLKRFKMANQGRRQKVFNVLEKKNDDLTLRIMDYKYVVSSGKNSSTHYRTYAYIKSPHFDLPSCYLRPENFMFSIGKMLGFKDINFDMYPEFSKKYYLKGDNEETIRNYFNREIIGYLEREKPMTIEILPNEILIAQSNKRVKPDQLEDFMSIAIKTAQVFMK